MRIQLKQEIKSWRIKQVREDMKEKRSKNVYKFKEMIISLTIKHALVLNLKRHFLAI